MKVRSVIGRSSSAPSIKGLVSRALALAGVIVLPAPTWAGGAAIQETPGMIRVRIPLAELVPSGTGEMARLPMLFAVPPQGDVVIEGMRGVGSGCEPEVRLTRRGVLRQIGFAAVTVSLEAGCGEKAGGAIAFTLRYDASRRKAVSPADPFAAIYDRLFRNDWREAAAAPETTLPAPWQPPLHQGSVYKIPIAKEGIYELDYATLSAVTDWNLASLDPRDVHLYLGGTEIPMVGVGESDGSFDPGDSFIFYGTGLTGENLTGVWQRGDFTDTNVYWLTSEAGAGLRMAQGPPLQGYAGTSSFQATVRFEQDNEMWGFIPNADDDQWIWDLCYWVGNDSSQAVSHHNVTIPGIVPGGPDVTLTYQIKGRSYDAANPDHHVIVKANGNVVDDFTFDDYVYVTRTVTFPSSYLATATDFSVEVTDPALLGITSDTIETNWFQLTYERDLTPSQDSLGIEAASGNQRFDVAPFTSSALTGLDLADPASPILLQGQVSPVVGGGFSFRFDAAVPAGGNDYYVAARTPVPPASITGDVPSNLLAVNPDWILIAPRVWLSSPTVASYLAFRASQGAVVEAVAVEDIYDEFGYGRFTPIAIRDFLQAVYQLSVPAKLQAVLLLGDAEYDYKDDYGDGNLNYVPTWMVADPGRASSLHPYAMHAWDGYFGAFAGGDNLPEILVGRIPAKSQQQADDALGKILAYETNPQPAGWLSRAGFLADCQDAISFEPIQDQNASHVFPVPPFSTDKIYYAKPPWNCATIDGDGNGQNDITEMFNQGTGIISWVGHGGFTEWNGVFTSPLDVDNLTNQAKPSLVLNANCYTGAFYHSGATTSLLEDLIVRQTGMAAGLGPGTYMFISQTQFATEPFYDAFFGRSKERQVGGLFYPSVATIEALGDGRLAQALTTFGDPLTVYPLPAPAAPLNFRQTASACRSVSLAWDPPDTLDTYSYDIYRAKGAGSFAFLANSSSTSYTDTSMVYGNTYTYYVTAVDSNGYEGKGTGDIVYNAAPCPPASPQNLSCTDAALGGRLDLTWDPVAEPELLGYRIYWGTSPGIYTGSVDVGQATSYRLEGLPEGLVYVAVTALNTFGMESAYSTETSCTVTHSLGWQAPRMVLPITLSKASGMVRVDWNLPVLDIWGGAAAVSRCSLYRSTTPDFAPDRSDGSLDRVGSYIPASSCAGGACFTYDANAPAQAHYYVTCETTDLEESSVSHAPPTYPTGFAYGKLGNTYHLIWNAVSTDIAGNPLAVVRYDIYRDTMATFKPDVKNGTNRVGSTATPIYQETPPPGPTYYYKVLAVDAKENQGPY